MATPVDVDSWGCTQLKVNKFTYLWTIENFMFHFTADDNRTNEIKSPSFSAAGTEWRLSLTPRVTVVNRLYGGKNVEFSLKFARVQSAPIGDEKLALKVKVEYTIPPNKSKPRPYDSPHTNTTMGEGLEEVVLGNITKDDIVNRVQSDGQLSIKFELQVHTGDKVYTRDSTCMYHYLVPPYNPQLGSALREGLFADFTLAVGDKELKAHKVVLAARSPVFKKMIESPMQENRENRVEITDFDPKVVQELLTYIYTGEAPNLKEMPQDLLKIAEKYDLQHLKIMCGEVLYHSLNVSNVVDTLLLADLHSIRQLKSACLSFAAAHFSEVTKTTGWDTLKTCNLELYIKVLEAQTTQQSAPPLMKKPRHF